MSKVIILAPDSRNVKTGRIASTYVPIEQTCPAICWHKQNKTCYAMGGNVALHVRRIEAAATGLSPYAVARSEAIAIRTAVASGKIPIGRPLRLHVSGDSRTIKAALTVAAASRKWRGPVFTYTSAWRTVPRTAWDGVSILGSIVRASDGVKALERGYAPAITVPTFESDRAYDIGGVKYVPCPAQTRDNVSCVDCKLCMDSDRLARAKMGIAFAIHGMRKNHGKRQLEVIK
jgi:hypothetical protein